MLKKLIYDRLPVPIRIQGRSFFPNLLRDLKDVLTNRIDASLPLRCLNVSGNGPFLYLGQQNFELCVHAGLQPTDTVLDLGCGNGRTAIAMKNYFTEGRYVGLDIIKFAITWCEKHIGASNPDFSFVHADVFNRTYNPRGRIKPEHYQLPFETGMFTFVLATSLFTHTMPATTENYLKECARVLRPGTKFVSSWFLLDEAAEQSLTSGKALLGFKHKFEGYRLNNIYAPEQAIAYDSNYVRSKFTAAELAIDHIDCGHWSGAAPLSKFGQDVVVAHRR